MKNFFKRFVATLVAIAALSAVAVNASAETHNCEDNFVYSNTYAFPHTHIFQSQERQITNSVSAGSHDHPILYDTNGKVIKTDICYLRADTVVTYDICGICHEAYDSHTAVVTVHSITP